MEGCVEGIVAEGRIVGVDRGAGKLVGARLDGVIAEVEIAGVVCMDAWQPPANTARTRIGSTLFIRLLSLHYYGARPISYIQA